MCDPDEAPEVEPPTMPDDTWPHGLDALLTALLPHLDPAVVRRILGLPPVGETDQRAS
jgi:hypothetical protein